MLDILIIGSGGAGLSAALSAKQKGSNVLVVGKSYPTASQTSMAQGGMNAAFWQKSLIDEKDRLIITPHIA